ncbi:transposase [uncultured Bacteroides sp.]|uniref:transposase n=1 Tax=uncultured Bacteroides sp. TaxID=162156 RepID=UPI002AAB9E79|nr:transposase [uncultured Bacteroides sp.]
MTKSSILNQYMDICKDVLSEVETKLNKSFKEFIIETLLLYMVIPQRINYLQLGRYSHSCEQRFRMNSAKEFDWLSFNLSLSRRILTGTRKAIAVDPSYISKSGKQTPWIGYFWSGCAGAARRGLEILGIGLIDVDNKDCISLEAVQTPDSITLGNYDGNLINWYLGVLEEKATKLQKVTRHIVADAYFSKKNFTDGLAKLGFHLISRFRDDAVLFYPTTQQPTGKRGRPKLYDSKIDFANLDLNRFEKINLLHIDKGYLYTTIAYSKSLKQMVKLVVWFFDNGKKHKLYFSTDINLSGKDVIETYRTRFQIEFNFRDAKQFAGLNQCQARNLSKLKFNFNASLTAVNVAKIVAKEKGVNFSMASLKTMMHNTFLLQRFICASGIRPNKRLNDKLFKELIEFAAIAA